MKQKIAKNWKVLSAAILLTAMLAVGTGYFQGVIASTDQTNPGQTADITSDGKQSGTTDGALVLLKPLPIYVTRPGNFVFNQGPSVLVPLGPAGATSSAAFKTSGTLKVQYTAECAVAAGTSTATWVDLNVQVKNLATNAITILSPTNQAADAFCTSNGTPAFDGWAMNTVTGIATGLPSGNYTVQIQATIQNGASGNQGWLGDTTLAISK